MTAPVLCYLDFNKPFTVQTKASLFSISGALSQLELNGFDHTVVYCYRAFTPQERNYIVTERECLDLIYFYKQFHFYLHGVKFTVVTERSLLQWLRILKEPEGILARCAIKLQAYQFEIIHITGENHHIDDVISKLLMSCYLVDEAVKLYELISKPDGWTNLTEGIQKTLKTVSKTLKKLRDNYLM